MTYHLIHVEDLYTLLQKNPKLMILDVRSEEEFEQTRIPNSYCLPLPLLTVEAMGNLMEKEGFSPDDPIYVSCRTGPRAIAACERLENSFKTIYHVKGCLTAWVDKDLPTVSGPQDLDRFGG